MKQARNIISRLALAALLGFFGITTHAQLNYDYTAGKFMIKGKVVDINTGASVSLANIRIKFTNRGVTCENDGSFTMYVGKNDTLEFSSTGYIPRDFRVADFDTSKYYVLRIELIPDFLKLKEVTIYPFKDLDGFKTAFIETKHLRMDFMGIAPPKYSNVTPKAKFSNPISLLYEKVKKKTAADPDFKP